MTTKHWRCAGCGRDASSVTLLLRLRADDLLEVVVACSGCRVTDALLRSLPVVDPTTVEDQMRRLAFALVDETGLPIVLDLPDGPGAGVREPRHEPPGSGSGAVELDLPE